MLGNSSHEFFKVYLSQLSPRQLGLPPAYVSKLGGKIPKNCTIKDSNGKIWKVKLESVEGGLVVANGWEEFVSQRSLVDGDSHLGVRTYGINGLRKRKAPDAVPSTIPAKKERKQGVEELSSSMLLGPRSQGPPPRRVYKTRNSKMPLRKAPTGLGCHGQFGVKLNQSRTHAMPRKAEEAASDFTSAHPYFKAVMTSRSLVGDLTIPQKFVMDYIEASMDYPKQRVKKLPRERLLTEDGKSSVTLNVYFKYKGQWKLLAPWLKFVRENRMKE